MTRFQPKPRALAVAEILIVSIAKRCRNLAGRPASDGVPAFGAGQLALVDPLGTGLIQAQQSRHAYLQPGEEADDVKIGQPAHEVIT